MLCTSPRFYKWPCMIPGLRVDGPHKRLYVNPTLPGWLPDIELHHLRQSLLLKSALLARRSPLTLGGV
jgi:hypothetical protein